MATRFEWDPDKAAANARKHGVYLKTAALAFADPLALTEQDRVENGELRWQTLGIAHRVLCCWWRTRFATRTMSR